MTLLAGNHTVKAATCCLERVLLCGGCGKIELGSRLFIAKSPSLSGLEAFVADLVLQAGKSGSLGSPLQVLKANCR